MDWPLANIQPWIERKKAKKARILRILIFPALSGKRLWPFFLRGARPLAAAQAGKQKDKQQRLRDPTLLFPPTIQTCAGMLFPKIPGAANVSFKNHKPANSNLRKYVLTHFCYSCHAYLPLRVAVDDQFDIASQVLA